MKTVSLLFRHKSFEVPLGCVGVCAWSADGVRPDGSWLGHTGIEWQIVESNSSRTYNMHATIQLFTILALVRAGARELVNACYNIDTRFIL